MRIVPTAGDYVWFNHPYKGKTVGRVLQTFIQDDEEQCHIRYWYDAFYGYDTIRCSVECLELIKDSRGYNIPMQEAGRNDDD